MEFVYGLIVGLVIAAVLAFLLYRTVIVRKLKAVATQVEQAAQTDARTALGAVRSEYEHLTSEARAEAARARGAMRDQLQHIERKL